MHPSESIRGIKSDMLSGKRIALCVTGSIAAVETVKIARELIRHGADVYPYMTRAARRFIGEDSLLFATGNDVILELTGRDEHLYDFDVVLVAPATADIISKAACGIADDAVSTLLLSNLERTIFVPAMDSGMWENQILQENMEKLKRFSKFVEPKVEEGKRKIPDVDTVVAETIRFVRNDLRDKRILVIGGAGYQRIDSFRIITNLATGRTAVELARYAYLMGGGVRLLIGLHTVQVPPYIPRERFSDVEGLIERIPDMLDYDAIFVPAALPDYGVNPREGKIKSLEEMRDVEFREMPKFLKELRKEYMGFLVGFKAESGIDYEELIRRARERMEAYSLDMVVANLIEDVDEETTRAFIILRDEGVEEYRGNKEGLAKRIMEIVVDSI